MRYRLLILGPQAGEYKEALRAECDRQLEQLGLTPDDFDLITDLPDVSRATFDNPVVAVWFGQLNDTTISDEEKSLVEKLFKAACPVFPVVDSTAHYTQKVPPILHPINGHPLDVTGLSGLVQRILGEWRLTPLLRKAFISYRRAESEGVAKQLFSLLGLRGFQVFLDTASVETGINFQNDLWDQMSNMDLVVFLGSPGALGSEWVRQEIARAANLGLGVVQLVWPGKGVTDQQYEEAIHEAKLLSYIGIPFRLEPADLQHGNKPEDTTFSSTRVKELIEFIETARIKSLGSRRTRLVAEFVEVATKEGHHATVRPEGSVELSKGGRKSGLAIIHLGVPGSEGLHEAENKFPKADPELRREDARLLYNKAGQTDFREQHLKWLNSRVDIKTVALDDKDDVATWLRGTP